MVNFSEINGKKVISLYEAELLGEIVNAVTDKALKKVRFFVLNGNDSLYFPCSAVSSVGKDAVMLKNKSRLVPRDAVPSPLSVLPLGDSVYTHDGSKIGLVTDLKLNGDKIEKLIVGETEIDTHKILSRSNGIIVINGGEEKVKLIPPVTHEHKRKPKQENIVLEQPHTEAVYEETKSEIALNPTVPQKASSSSSSSDKALGYSFLLGRLATSELYSSSGEIIVREGEIITDEILTKANADDKLLQLALRSK